MLKHILADQDEQDTSTASKTLELLSYLVKSMTEIKPITYFYQQFKNIFKVDISGIFQTWATELERLIKSHQGLLVLKNV